MSISRRIWETRQRAFLWATVAATLAQWYPAAAVAQGPGRAALVGVAPIQEREVSAGQSFVGTVNPQKKSTIGSPEEGRVIEFLVNEGDLVAAGQELAELRTDTLRIELAQAQAEAELRRQEWLELTNGTRPEEKDQAAAELARTKALMEYADARLRRAQRLFTSQQAVSQDELDAIVSETAAAKNNYLVARAKYDLAEKGPREEQKLQAQSRHEAQLQVVAKIEDMIKQRTIRAPFDGYVTAEYTEKGEWLSRGDPVVDLVNLEAVEVLVAVPEQFISNVRTGMKVPVRLEALPGDAFEGEIIRIVPQADVRSRTFPVIVRVANRDSPQGTTLKAGMLARAILAVGKPQRAMLVPKDALVLGGEAPRVFVVQRDPQNPNKGKALPVRVEIGVADEDLIQVLGDVARGQLVVVRGNERLLPFGQDVEIIQ